MIGDICAGHVITFYHKFINNLTTSYTSCIGLLLNFFSLESFA